MNTETSFPEAPEDGPPAETAFPSGYYGENGEYLKWLEADLKAAHANRADQPFIVAVGHRPWSTHDGSWKYQQDPYLKAFRTLFAAYEVDLYICGHKHYYSRQLPNAGVVGTPCAVNGGAGCDQPTVINDDHFDQRWTKIWRPKLIKKSIQF